MVKRFGVKGEAIILWTVPFCGILWITLLVLKYHYAVMRLSEKSVIKHSATIQITNRINLLQRRAWNVLLANAYDDLPRKEKHQLKIKELMSVLGHEKSENSNYIKEICKALIGCMVEWNILAKDGEHEWGASGLLAEVIIRGGVLTYAYSPTLRERLYNPAMYARISLSMQNRFNSKHSLAIYELCVDYFINKRGRGETPWILIADYRKLMGISPSEYPEFKKLNKWIIKDPLEEINQKSDLRVDAEYKKENRKVVALKLRICPHPNRPNLLEELQTIPSIKQLVKPGSKSRDAALLARLQDFFCLSPSQAQDILGNHDPEYIQGNLERVERDYKAGKVKDIAPYTLKALSDDFRPKKTAFDSEREETERLREKLEEDERRVKELEADYDRAVKEEAERIMLGLSEDERKENIRLFEEEVIENGTGYSALYKQRGLQGIFQKLFENFLVKKLGSPEYENFIGYAKNQGIELTRDGNGDYHILNQPASLLSI